MKSLSLWKEVAVHLFSKHETFCEESQSWQLSVFSNNLRLPCACIGVKTKTSSWEGYKVAVACTLSVSFRGEIKLNRLQIIAFQIYRNIGVEDDICGKLLFSREFANRRIHA